jgi:hypothetical protein
MEPIQASLKVTYRALLARGLEAGEAANLTAFLHGLPSAGLRWTMPEVEAILRRHVAHAAEQRAAASPLRLVHREGRTSVHDRRSTGSGVTSVIDPPNP